MSLHFDRLDSQKQLFVLALLKGDTSEQAAVAAGVAGGQAKKTGLSWIKQANIKRALDELKAERAARAKYDADKLLQRLIEIDALDVLDILDEKGDVLPIQSWNSAWRRSVHEVTVRQNLDGSVTTRVKLPDRLKNLELLGKHIGVQAFKADNLLEITVSGIDALHAKRLGGEHE